MNCIYIFINKISLQSHHISFYLIAHYLIEDYSNMFLSLLKYFQATLETLLPYGQRVAEDGRPLQNAKQK